MTRRRFTRRAPLRIGLVLAMCGALVLAGARLRASDHGRAGRAGMPYALTVRTSLCATGPFCPHPLLVANPRAASPHGAEAAAVDAARGAPPPLIQPSAARPLSILVVGDSLGEDLEYGMADLLGERPSVRLAQDAVGSSGLADVSYYNWPARLAADIAASRPRLVVVMLGGNDVVSFDQAGVYVGFGTARWRADYGRRVAAMMAEATGAGARVLWVGLPVMAAGSVLSNVDMRRLNAVYWAQAGLHPGAAFVSTWRLFQGPDGGFTQVLKDDTGSPEEVRDADGVHIAPTAGDELVASDVLGAIDRDMGVRLCPASPNPWSGVGPAPCSPAR